MNMEGLERKSSVTLGQGDRSGQVCVCVCARTLLCQRFVPGQQVASQRTSMTFSLSLPHLLLPLSMSPVPNTRFISLGSEDRLCTTSYRHSQMMNTHIPMRRCGWFIHGPARCCFDTVLLNNVNVLHVISEKKGKSRERLEKTCEQRTKCMCVRAILTFSS